MNKGIFSFHVLKIGLLAGTLDILAALLHYFIKTNKDPLPVLKFIASGVFGKEAFTGGNSMYIWGLVFHFLIAIAFTVFFFWAYSLFPSLFKYRLLTGIVYGLFIWAVMQFIVLPLSNAPKMAFRPLNAMLAAGILIVCIGIPLAFLVGKRYSPVKNKLHNS